MKTRFKYEQLAAEMLKKREKEGISQRDAAKAIGIAQPHFNRMEFGTENPSIQTLLKVCDWLKKDVQFFIQKSK